MSTQECLVVVDMQDYFLQELYWLGSEEFSIGDEEQNMNPIRRDYLIERCLHHISVAKRQKIPIICLELADLEYEDSIESICTVRKIRMSLSKYPFVYYGMKSETNGSQEVIDILNGIEPRMGMSCHSKSSTLRKWISVGDDIRFRICGVNLDACVQETRMGLEDMGYRVDLLIDASRNCWDDVCADTSQVDCRWYGERLEVCA